MAGCKGQIETALASALIDDLGHTQVIAVDLVDEDPTIACRYYKLDVTDFKIYEKIVQEEDVDYVLHHEATLYSLGEKYPDLAYDVNVNGAANALNIAKDRNDSFSCHPQ